MLVSQEVVAAPSAVKEEEDEVSDKGSESDEGEANKDSPSERDEDSDKQSDTEVDEMAGDDEEVRELSMQLGWHSSYCFRKHCQLKMLSLHLMNKASSSLHILTLLGVGGIAAKHPAARAGAARNQVQGDAPRLQPLLPRGEAGVVVALHRRPPRSDPCLHALPRLHIKRHRGGELVHMRSYR